MITFYHKTLKPQLLKISTLSIVFLLTLVSSFSYAQPANDDICNAIPLTSGIPLCGQDNTGATVAGSDVLGSCWEDAPTSGGGAVLSNTVWYSMVCPPSGGIYLTTDFIVAGGLLDTEMAIYSSSDGTCTGNLTEEDCNEDPSTEDRFSGHARIRATGLIPGDTYFILLDGRSTSGVVYDEEEADEDYGTSTTGEYCILGVEFGGGSGAAAGTSLDYFCSPDFTEYDAESTDLIQDCHNAMNESPGFFDQQSFPNCVDPVDVYNFELDCGFQFEDAINNNFIGCEYSITMHWKYDQTNSPKEWQRLIDWSNHTSDDGMYVSGKAGGTYEFWDETMGIGAGIGEDDDWNTGVFTRDCDGNFCMYHYDGDGNGGLIECIVDGGTGIVQNGDFINFFTDDDKVKGETAPGQIAYLEISNYAKTEAEINEMIPTMPCPCAFSPPPTCEITAQSNEICFGDGNSSLEVEVEGDGVDIPYTVTWPSGNITTPLNSGDRAIELGLPTGFQVVTVTDNLGLEGTCSAYISSPTPVLLDTIFTELACNGDTDAAIDLSAGGGIGALTVIWEDGSSDEDRTGLAAGTYGVTVTDEQGCSQMIDKTFADPPAIVLSETHNNETSCGNPGTTDGSIDLTWEGGGTYNSTSTPTTFTYFGGTAIDKGATTTFDLITAVTQTTVDINTLSQICIDAEDAMGQAGGFAITIEGPLGQQQLLTSTLDGNMNQAIDNVCFDATALLNISTTTADYTGSWIPEEGAPLNDLANPLIGETASGTWHLIIDDGGMNGGTLNSFSMVFNDIVVRTGPPTYLWSTGETTQDVGSLTGSNGFIAYTVTATDDNLCTATQVVNIWCPVPPTCSIQVDSEPSCFGVCDGSATLTVDGGSSPIFDINWGTEIGTVSAAGLTHQAIALCSGTHVVTVTDSEGQFETCNVTITDPDEVIVDYVSHTEPLCNGSADGTITVAASGGDGAFGFIWSPSASSQTSNPATGLSAGLHTVTVMDGNGCTAEVDRLLVDPVILSSNISATSNPLCDGQANGTATVEYTGGTADYSVDWDAPGGNVANQVGPTHLGTGFLGDLEYCVTITDANSCTVSSCVTLIDPDLVTANATGTNPTCGGLADGETEVTK